MSATDASARLAAEIAALESGANVPWPKLGRLCGEVERLGLWRAQAGSFTEWMRHLAMQLDLTEGSLWRVLSSARFYVELRDSLTKRGVNLPPLEALPRSVSPESLELLSKLMRVAAPTVTDPLAKGLVEGSVTRAQLRSTWLAYRPVLAGRTARGRGVAPPRFNRRDLQQFNSRLEANVMAGLLAAGPAWTGTTNPSRYELFTQVRPQSRRGDQRIPELDAVAAVRGKADELLLHGIDIRGQIPRSHQFLEYVTLVDPFCDFLWIASHDEDVLGTGRSALPEHVGLLLATPASVRVLRAAQRGQGARTGDLAKGLLLRSAMR